MSIHPTAIIDPTAEIGAGVEIGPYSVIGPHCQVGEGSKIWSNATLQGYTKLGKNCQVSPGAVLGGFPQDLKFKGEESWVVVGDNTVIRECVTLNRASGEGQETVVGSNCLLMAYAHVAHNCHVGNEVIMANSVQLGGHVEVGDFAFIGGMSVFHQHIRIGKLAIISGFSAARQDIPPFAMADNRPAFIVGLNKVGLKRRGFDLSARTRLKRAFQLLFFSGMNFKQAIETIQDEIQDDLHVDELIAFVQSSERGIYRPNRVLRGAIDELSSPSATSLEPLSNTLVETP
ncbi:MAG TPA: acyl-ACP--UDP-N-acetylglucosamine O-acyltransferase [Coleofasciculaceae cyanobacterium]|jgi:UDP-N-acetylglucosamine acyltransferase